MPCHAPIYQPVYHFHHSLLNIHLVAIVDQALRETYLQRIADYLSITISIYSELNSVTIAQLDQHLNNNKPGLTPVLLLDYERYEAYNTECKSVSNIKKVESKNEEILPKSKPSDDIIDASSTLKALIDDSQLPKILLSRKPERGIHSAFLEKFEGFLNKPINITLMVSELIRLAQKPTTATQIIEQPPISLGHDKTTDAATQKLAITDKHTDLKAVEQTSLEIEITAPLILVVEDNPINQKVTCKLLSKLNYRSMVAENGEQALALLKTHRHEIALILMDCRMPVMDGLEATQAIRGAGDDIAIIALTANDSAEDRSKQL